MKSHVVLSEREFLSAINAIDEHTQKTAGLTCPFWISSLMWVPLGFSVAYILDQFGVAPAVAVVVSVVSLIAGSRILAARNKNQLYSYIATDNDSLNVEYEFLDTYFDVCTEGSKTRSEWSAVSDVLLTDEFLLLFTDKAHAYVLPRRLPEAMAIFELASSKHDEARTKASS